VISGIKIQKISIKKECRKNYKELSELPKVWIRMKCTIWLFSPKCVSVLGKEKCAEKPKYI
jgi:hypothetical protein